MFSDFFSKVKTFLWEKTNGDLSSGNQPIRWGFIEPKFQLLVARMRIIVGTESLELSRSRYAETIPLIQEIVPFVRKGRLLPDPSDQTLGFRVRSNFIEVWSHLLKVASSAVPDPKKRRKQLVELNEIPMILEYISAFLEREEFEVGSLCPINPKTQKPIGNSQEVDLAQKFQKAMYKTLILAQRLLISQAMLPLIQSRFVSKVFVFSFFRIPGFSAQILPSFQLPDCDIDSIAEILRDIVPTKPSSTSSPFSSISTSTSTSNSSLPLSFMTKRERQDLSDLHSRENPVKEVNIDGLKLDPVEELVSLPETSSHPLEMNFSYDLDDFKRPSFSSSSPLLKSQDGQQQHHHHQQHQQPTDTTQSSYSISKRRKRNREDTHFQLLNLSPNWDLFHEVMGQPKYADMVAEEKLAVQVCLLKTHPNILLQLSSEWIRYIRIYTSHPHRIKWWEVPGYQDLVFRAIFMLYLDQLNENSFCGPIVKAVTEIITTNTCILNAVFKIVIPKTRAYEFDNVHILLGNIEEIGKRVQKENILLSPQFDYKIFVEALDIIIQSDHGSTLNKCLSSLYHFSDILCGFLRERIFADFLLPKYFFTLFCHWDVNIRSSFQQILLFKALRSKRSSLEEGVPDVKLENIFMQNFVGSHFSPLDEEALEEERKADRLIYGKIEYLLSMITADPQQDFSEDLKQRLNYSSHQQAYMQKALEEFQTLKHHYKRLELQDLSPPTTLISPAFGLRG